MQLKINIILDAPLIMPIGYHHILQSALYLPFRGNEDVNNLHDEGVKLGKRDYKLFTFGPLNGKYIISGNKIVFRDYINLEVRSCYDNVIYILAEYFQNNGIRLWNMTYQDLTVEICNYHVIENDIVINMMSPVCAHETDVKTKYTHYFNPNEIKFYQYIEENFVRKYIAYSNEIPREKITFSKINVETKDKYITKYKNFIIEGYQGKYRLKGNPQYLDFLYQVGLGEKNSQGFGMFEVI